MSTVPGVGLQSVHGSPLMKSSTLARDHPVFTLKCLTRAVSWSGGRKVVHTRHTVLPLLLPLPPQSPHFRS
ncbi:hypothetical protein J6590_059180 [Homalodisca vitripennis]|nr:hypothetical protein J6590_059180 [Homalodisca vitripennis]